MSTIAENPRYSCTLGGAIPTLKSFHRAIPILHAGPGCGMQLGLGNSYTSGFQGAGYIGSNSLPSTNTYEKEIVFGGEERLKEVIEHTLEIIEGDFYFVLTGCTSEIIGDDINSVIQEFKKQGYPISYAETAGFKGNTYLGYHLVWESVIKEWVKPLQKNPEMVNIFGIVPEQDVFWQGNLKEIVRILKRLGLTVNSFFTNNQGLETIKSSSSAALNIILSPWLAQNIVDYYQSEFETPYIRFPGPPVGPTATGEFLTQIGEALHLDSDLVKFVIAEEESNVYDNFEKVIEVFTGFGFQHNFAIVGDSNTVLGMTKFLANDFGQFPAIAIITDSPSIEFKDSILNELNSLEVVKPSFIIFEQDSYEIGKALINVNPTYILGSSLERDIAKEIGALFQSISFPVTDRLVLNRGYTGYRGSITLIEDYFAPAFAGL